MTILSEIGVLFIRKSLRFGLLEYHVILATELGVWETKNFMDSVPNWNPANNGLANVRVDMLQLRESDYTIMAATHGRGVYTSQFLGGIGIEENELKAESNFEVYPNPVQDQFQLSFKQDGIWEMELYNLQGQLIWRDRYSSKFPDKKFRLTDISKGQYILTLRRGSEIRREKILVP